MPMERIPRYKMFLQELLESTPPDHIDFGPLQAAIKSVDLVAYKIQEIIIRRENARKIEEVGAKVGLDLRGKRFVREGIVRKVCRSKVQKYYFVLLEDGKLEMKAWWILKLIMDACCDNSRGVRSTWRRNTEEEVPFDRSLGVQTLGQCRRHSRRDQLFGWSHAVSKVRLLLGLLSQWSLT